MSGRQSLYGQSLVRNANALNFGHDSSQEKHWKRDWYTPSKTVSISSTSITPSATPTPFGDEKDTPSLEQQQQNHKFKVKVWSVDLDYKPIIDGEEEDILDIEEFSIIKKRDADGLSEDAIRGAVGGGESIPGISNGKSDQQKDVAEESNPEETPEKQLATDKISETTDTEVKDTQATDEPKTQTEEPLPSSEESKGTNEAPEQSKTTETTEPIKEETKQEDPKTDSTSEVTEKQTEPKAAEELPERTDQEHQKDAEGDVVIE